MQIITPESWSGYNRQAVLQIQSVNVAKIGEYFRNSDLIAAITKDNL